MRQLIAGGVLGLTSLFVLESDNNIYISEVNKESHQIIEVPTTQQLIETTDLYFKMQKIEEQLNDETP